MCAMQKLVGLILVILLTMAGIMTDAKPDPENISASLILIRRSYGLHDYPSILTLLDPATGKQWLIGEEISASFFGYASDGAMILIGYDESYHSNLYRLEQVRGEPEKIASDVYGGAEGFQVWWSPDHDWLFYLKYNGEKSTLYSIRADGSEGHNLSSDVISKGGVWSNPPPAISPDGQWIAFSAGDANDGSDVYRVQRDARGLQNLTDDWAGYEYVLGWLPNDNILLLLGPGDSFDPQHPLMYGPERVYAVDMIGNRWEFLDNVTVPVFPFFDSLAKPPAALLLARVNGFYDILAVRPDGSIAWQTNYWRFPFGIGSDAWVVTASEGFSDSIRITGTTAGTYREVRLPNPFDAWATQTKGWSPDGTWLVFRTTDLQTGQGEIWRLDLTTGNLNFIWGDPGATISDVAVSPDGTGIIAHVALPDWSGLLYMTLDGQHLERWTDVRDPDIGRHEFVDWADHTAKGTVSPN